MVLRKDKQGNPVEVHGIKIHPLANMVPMAVPEEQKALQKSIEINGQREDIIFYRDHIIDGRCRALACDNLGIDVKFTTLPHKMSLAEVEELVRDVNTRRNLTASQKAIIAFRECRNNTAVEPKDVCEAWGVGKNNYYAAKYLSEHRPDYLQLLFDGYKVPVNDGRKSGSVQVVTKYVKRQIENLKADAVRPIGTDGFNDVSLLVTQAAKDWYTDAMNHCGGFDTRYFDSRMVSDLLISIAEKNTH